MRVTFSQRAGDLETLNEIRDCKKELDELFSKIEGLRSHIFYLRSNPRYIFKASKLIGLYFLPGILSASWSHGVLSLKTMGFWSKVRSASNAFWGIRSFGGAAFTTILFGGLFQNLIVKPYKGEIQEWRIRKRVALLENRTIPERFHSDPILSRNICPITTFPIAIPCVTPNNNVYEYEAILAWVVDGNETCPITRNRLLAEDLYIDGDKYKMIRNRVRELEGTLR